MENIYHDYWPVSYTHLDVYKRQDLYDEKGRNVVTVDFKPSACVYDSAHGATILPADSITLEYNDYYGEAVQEEMKKLIPEYLSIVRAAERKLHYLTA